MGNSVADTWLALYTCAVPSFRRPRRALEQQHPSCRSAGRFPRFAGPRHLFLRPGLPTYRHQPQDRLQVARTLLLAPASAPARPLPPATLLPAPDPPRHRVGDPARSRRVWLGGPQDLRPLASSAWPALSPRHPRRARPKQPLRDSLPGASAAFRALGAQPSVADGLQGTAVGLWAETLPVRCARRPLALPGGTASVCRPDH